MATKRPRVFVTTTPQVMAALDKLQALTGQSKSGMISELIDAALPALQAAIEALQVVKEQPREAERLMAAYTAHAINAATQEQIDFGRALDARTMEGKRARRSQRGTP